MKLFCVLLVGLICISNSLEEKLQSCTLKPADVPKSWLDMVDPCIEILQAQVKTEIDASLTYLAMGSHFARDVINRLGFSKLFFESASEEREHAIKIIEYLLMRGQLTKDVYKLLKFPLEEKREEWGTAADALRDALELEAKVTRNIRDIIIKCEHSVLPNNATFNDYHLVDYLTGEFLDEQYKGQRDLAGKLSTLGKMMATHGPLGEFLYDKKLLNGEI